MASSITLAVKSPAGKKAMRNLPSNIEIGHGTTVEECKKIIARATRTSDHHRVAIVDTTTNSIIKDRLSILAQQPGVKATGEIAVKDLGPQISWRTVYLVEYAGPLLLALLLAYPLRPYIYPTALFGTHPPRPLSGTQTLALWMLLAHFAKRELETVFVHKFSAATMPAAYIVRNSAHYWLLAGLNISYFVFAPNAVAARPLVPGSATYYTVVAGAVLFVLAELANLYTHVVLANLRPRGTTARGIPRGFGFDWVTCPNYLFEILAWVGVGMVTRSWATGLFVGVAWWMMQRWAVVRELRYRKEFAGVYTPHRYPLTPGLALPVRKAKV